MWQREVGQHRPHHTGALSVTGDWSLDLDDPTPAQ